MKTILSISLIFLCLSPFAFGADQSQAASEIVQNAKTECASFEDGEFNATEQAISLHDLTGDGQPEEIVDASQFSCSTSASMWGGSGGTFLWVVVDGKPYEFLANKWKTVDFDGQSVLLLAVHSSECSDTVGPCYRALVWRDGFRTTR
ncbi:hypothetical protein [Photobacterium lutimaris]|uniref:Uncharacterized protein n=1 Tax=Photobacterium lutimaris TaxID=388278 RepID=A0A2T3IY62_9GAMM|nr:hypothetical protein [Photobacterium lutimaris]PSU33502.1 hypothetical protein C9I99_12025 [Photobacterium lutimaris]TDR74667.1 hypothetical protein DFP78_107255 [Photobacterium lutimaris]